MIGCVSIAAVALAVRFPMGREALFILLWLFWTVILAVGISYVFFSVGAFS